MSLRSGKLPFLGSEDEFFYHTTQHRILILPIHSLLFGEGGSDEAKQLQGVELPSFTPNYTPKDGNARLVT
jgi:hypothetical protein